MAIRDYLFVYGTLRRTQNHPMHSVLTRYAKWAGEGTFQGKLYDLGSYPAAVSSNNPDHAVCGELYAVTDGKHLFCHLDSYEGPGFRREKRMVTLSNGRKVRSWIYLYHRPLMNCPLIDSGDYSRFQKVKA